MNRFQSKICPELLNEVKVAKNGFSTTSCIVYANNFEALKREAQKRNLPAKEFPFIRALGLNLSQKDVVCFAKMGATGYIAKQTKVSALVFQSKQILGVQKFYDAGVFGQDVSVAVIDTGVSSHLDFCVPQNRIVEFVDLIAGKKVPYDDNGHGTFVASIVAGSGLVSNKKFSGIAPQSKIVAIKALEKSGESGAEKILEAMQWVSDNHKRLNIRVVCMSFGSSPVSRFDPLVVGAEALWNMGVAVVAAAGNSGPEPASIKSPGFSSKIITVGGVNDFRDESNFRPIEIASFSSRGPAGNFFKPDVVAPAVNITGAHFDEKAKEFYQKMSGTSVATPMIAGICALIISKNPQITPDQLKIRLLHSCKSISGKRNAEGFGIPDLSNFFVF